MTADDKVIAIQNLLRHGGQVLPADELLERIRRIAEKEHDDREDPRQEDPRQEGPGQESRK